MSTYFRVMSGRGTRSPFSHRFVIALVVLIIAASIVIDWTAVRHTIRSPVGIAAVVAMVAGLTVRRLMALTPWYLLTVALSLDALLPVVDDKWASILGVAQYALLGSACITAFLQMKVELTGQGGPGEGSLVAWGSVWVALSLLIVAVVS